MIPLVVRDAQGILVAQANMVTGWHEVPLETFLKYQQVQQKQRFTPAVLALLTGVPEEILASDISYCVPFWKPLDWVRNTLPEGAPERAFTLGHTRYVHVGNLDVINTAQFEALVDFIREHQADPIQAAPQLLAVLYKPEGQEQTPEIVEQTAEHFRQLPMSLAYPIVADFFRAGASSASSILMYSDLRPKVEHLLQTLESTLLSNGASKSSSKRLRRWLLRTWIKYARAAL